MDTFSALIAQFVIIQVHNVDVVVVIVIIQTAACDRHRLLLVAGLLQQPTKSFLFRQP